MKKLLSVCLMAGLAGDVAMADVIENFDAYSAGAFTSQTTNWSGSTDWQIGDMGGGNMALTLPSTAGELKLICTAEQFSAAGSGYTILFSMYAQGWDQRYSGVVCDSNSDGSSGHRFFPTDNTTFLTIGGGSISDSWSMAPTTLTYFRIYRQGDKVLTYYSLNPITLQNLGTLAIDNTVPALTGGGNYLGLYGVGTVWYDNISFLQGSIPEPTAFALVLAGAGLFLRRRR